MVDSDTRMPREYCRADNLRQSLFGVVIAALWLGEQLHWGHLWGGAAIITGLILGLSRQVRRVSEDQKGATLEKSAPTNIIMPCAVDEIQHHWFPEPRSPQVRARATLGVSQAKQHCR